MSSAIAVSFVAGVVVYAGIFLFVLALGLRLAERILARDDPDPLEAEVFGTRHARKVRRLARAGSPAGRLTKVAAALVGGGFLVLACVQLLDRLI